jgi:steroid delta-isomerase-like uncharacterized protein
MMPCDSNEGAHPMPQEQNKTLVRRYFEDLFNKGNLVAVNELFAANAVLHNPLTPEPLRGTEAIKQFVTGGRTTFPDFHFTVEDVFGEGNQFAVRWTFRGTCQGEFAGIPSTGRQAIVPGVTIFHLVGGKIAEMWVNWNVLSLMQQLGGGTTPTVGVGCNTSTAPLRFN